MKPLAQIIFGLSLAFCLTTQRVNAQDYAIDWHQVAGGGGLSMGGTFSVTGTIGQPDAGATLSGGEYSLTGGFWSLVSVLQAAGSPTLSIRYAGGTATVYWQAHDGFFLQENHDLNAPGGWTNSLGSVTVSGVSFHKVGSSVGPLFFRLKR